MSKAYAENYKLIKWGPIKSAEPMPEEQKGQGAYFMPDIAPFRSPLSGRIISSRPQLRHEERAYNVRQVGTDLKPSDYDAANQRPSVEKTERAFDAAFKRAAEKVWG